MVSRCKNPSCEYAPTCAIRRADMVVTKNRVPTDDALAPPLPSEPPPRQEPWKDPIDFSVKPSDAGLGWVGVFDVRGRLEDHHREVLMSHLGDILDMKGLFLRIDTPGGSGIAGLSLHVLVVAASSRMPVVGWARQAMSAGVLPLAACDAKFARPYARLGGFGCVRGICDGMNPRTMANSQSPYKWPDDVPAPWLDFTFCRNGDEKKIQGGLDRQYDEELAQVSRYTGIHPRRLKRYMDGRILTPRQALRIGLIDDIGYEDAAYRRLLTLIKRKEP